MNKPPSYRGLLYRPYTFFLFYRSTACSLKKSRLYRWQNSLNCVCIPQKANMQFFICISPDAIFL